MKYIVDKEMPLMAFLIEKTHKKKNDIKNLLKYKNVSIDGIITTHVSYPLKIDQIVEVNTAKKPLPFDIIYEDKDIIVIDKPCGLLSEETNKEKQKTAYYMVKQYLKNKHENIYLVHRLDQYTSGILMFVKTKQLYQLLTHNWNQYVITRGYIAIVEGHLNKKQDTIINKLAEAKNQTVYISSQGKTAITHYKVIQENKHYSLLEVYLDTGRKNQIRVHMSYLKHPIIGDTKYGAKTNPIKRLGLHAHEFTFMHPLTHKEMHFTSKMPESFEKLMKNS
ncbi:MAG: RluA family pseudouridine synthase [Erysipelotrichaceae bacterium]|nr:RluA family pseudouridine synthase [Erysipelotrichaceae bacterium]